jgi:hypothetical protein
MIAFPKNKLYMILPQPQTGAIDMDISLAKSDISCKGKFPGLQPPPFLSTCPQIMRKLFTANHPNQNVTTIRLSSRCLIALPGIDMTQISVDSDASFTTSMYTKPLSSVQGESFRRHLSSSTLYVYRKSPPPHKRNVPPCYKGI